jgi:hypothetical protein
MDLVRLYAVELLASAGAPVVILAVLGLGVALRLALTESGRRRTLPVVLLILLPAAIHAATLFGKLDPFPRHLLPFFPWLMLLAAAALVAITDRLQSKRGLLAAIYLVVFGWQTALVIDTERLYITEPRNETMRWIDSNAPKGGSVSWPGYEAELKAKGFKPEKYFDEGKPDVVVAELYSLNHFLSGSGRRESYPTDYRRVFDSLSPPRLVAFQDLYRGKAGYTEAARFEEGYFMPELRLSDRILGNRSRNYLSTVVIYRP